MRLNYETGHVYCIEEEKYDAEVFLDFLKSVLKVYPAGRIIMILDNANKVPLQVIDRLCQRL